MVKDTVWNFPHICPYCRLQYDVVDGPYREGERIIRPRMQAPADFEPFRVRQNCDGPGGCGHDYDVVIGVIGDPQQGIDLYQVARPEKV